MIEEEEKSRCDQVYLVSGVRGVTTYLQNTHTHTHARTIHPVYTRTVHTLHTTVLLCIMHTTVHRVSLFSPIPSPSFLLCSFSSSHHVVGDEEDTDHN
jgi:hypothetical protein